jgi:hypothetical protein
MGGKRGVLRTSQRFLKFFGEAICVHDSPLNLITLRLAARRIDADYWNLFALRFGAGAHHVPLVPAKLTNGNSTGVGLTLKAMRPT